MLLSPPSSRSSRALMPLLVAALGFDLGCVDMDHPDTGGGGGGPFNTSFVGAVSRDTIMGILRFTVATTSFSPAATSSGLTSAELASVSATGTYKQGGHTVSLTGSWDESLNTLALSGSGATVTGGYNVPTGYVAGELTDASGGPDAWQALLSHGSSHSYCGTWDNGSIVKIAFVIDDGDLRGLGTGGVSFVGSVTGSAILFGAVVAEPIGSATITGTSITGTLSGGPLTASAC